MINATLGSLTSVRAQYSGKEHRGVKGIGVVSLVHSGDQDEEFYPIDSRVYAPDVEGKTKNQHFQERFVNALDQNSSARVRSCLPGGTRRRAISS